MRSIAVTNLKPDMIVGHNIYSSDGQLLLAEGFTLTSHFISRLDQLGIPWVHVDDEESSGIRVSDVIPEHTRNQATKSVVTSFEAVPDQENIRSANLPIDDIQMVVDELLATLTIHESQIFNVVSVKTYDEYTYQHCVNVAVLSIIVGMAVGLPEGKIVKLGLGAMLHDIGKMYVPLEVLNKPGRLDAAEFEVIKGHSRLGFEVVKHDRALSPLSANIILRHHERIDGSGYPDGLEGDDIHLFSRIVAVSDMYDAITSNRPYRRPLTPTKAVQILVGEAERKLDKGVIWAMCSHIPPYPVGSGILLSTGDSGLVVSYDSADPASPVVRILFTSPGKKLSDFYEIDLRSEREIRVSDSAVDGSDETLLAFYEKLEAAAA